MFIIHLILRNNMFIFYLSNWQNAATFFYL